MKKYQQFIAECMEFLLEDRLDFLKTSFKDKLTPDHVESFDTHAEHKDAGAIVDHFASKADPSPNKQHTQWILRQYAQKKFRQEDVGRIHDTLENFDKYKGKLPNKDLNQYKGLTDVRDAVAPHLGTFTSNRAEVKAVKHEGAETLHDSPDLNIVKLKTEEAACHYGAGTQWCTAAKHGNNTFFHYNKEGPLYVVHDKKENKKYQFHFESDQFMNENDEPIDIDKLVEKHPVLMKIKEFKQHPAFMTSDEVNHKVLDILDRNKAA